MRRLTRSDDGAVAVLVAVLAVVLFGFAALVIDVGAMYAERRQLQNGADAGALALARDCMSTAGCPSEATANATATGYGGSNDRVDGQASATVCGNAGTGWSPCTDPPAVPPGVEYVRVTDRTVSVAADGTSDDELPPILAGVLVEDYTGKQVSAKSTVAWGFGTMTKAPVLPFVMSVCEWEQFMPAEGGAGFAPMPTMPVSSPPPAGFPWAYEGPVHTHGGTTCTYNPSGQTGAEETVPGDFGWLSDGKSDGCSPQVDSSSDLTVLGKNGTYEKCLDDFLTANLGRVVDVPIYAVQPSKSTPTEYTISGFMPFLLTGWSLSGSSGDLGGRPSTVTKPACLIPPAVVKGKEKEPASDRCLTGIPVVRPAGPGPSIGPSFGLTTTQTTLVE